MHCICYRINNNYFLWRPIEAESEAGLDMVQLHQKGKAGFLAGYLFSVRQRTENLTVIQIPKTNDCCVVDVCGLEHRLQKMKTTFPILSIN